MTTIEIKKAIAEKLKAEETGFTYNDISVTKAKMPMTTTWNEEKDGWDIEMVDAIRVVIKGFEHIHFFIQTEVDEYFGNSIWVWEKSYYTDTNEYSNEGSEIIYDTYGKNADWDLLEWKAALNIGYYIASRF